MENIEVSVRVRPINTKENQNNDESIWKIENNNKTITLLPQKSIPSPVQTRINKNGAQTSNGSQVNAFNSTLFSSPASFGHLPNSTSNISTHTKASSSLSPFSQNPNKKKKSKKALIQNPSISTIPNFGNANSISIGNNSSQNSFQSQSNSSVSGPAHQPAEAKRKVSYTFDQCFREEDTNNEIYQQMVKRVALSSLHGINGTVFMYGQTGSGKTYTMLGRERKEVMQHEQVNNVPSKSSKKERNSEISKKQKATNISVNQNTSKLSISPDVRKSGTDVKCQSPSKQDKGAAHQAISEAGYLSGRKQASNMEQPGVLIYSLEDLFKEIKEDKEKTFFLRCSYVEIYNELVYDLLRDQDTINECLQLNEDKNKDFYIRGVIEEPVSSIEEILYFLRRGELNRHYAQTKLNHSSSRSHTMFRLQVQSITNNFLQKTQSENKLDTHGHNSLNPHDNQQQTKHSHPNKEIKKYVTQSVLNFVDLAGSEKVSSHYDNKDPDELYVMDFGDQVPKIDEKVQTRIKEGKNINKSLFFLTQVISLRAEGKPSPGATGLHIPYRNSPLTKILRSSLGGNARTCVIVCTTPCKSQMEQTVSSLRFGQNAMKIENKVHANIITNNNEEAVKILIADYERKIKSLEKVKKEQQQKKDYEIRIIDQLVDEKKKLLEKIQYISNKKFKSLVKATGQCHLMDYRPLENAKSKTFFMVNMENVGTLELTERLGQHILSLHEKNTFEQELKHDNETKYHNQKKNHPYIEKCYKQMALDVIKVSRKTTVVGQEQLRELQKCIQELKIDKSKLEQNLLLQQENTQSKQDMIQKLANILEELKQENEMLKLKERFYEGFDSVYIQQVKDEWLNTVEFRFTQIIEKLKEEKARRHYTEKIENLKEQIRKLQDQQAHNGGQGVEQQQTLESVLFLLQQSESQNIIDGVKTGSGPQNQDEELVPSILSRVPMLQNKSMSYKYNEESQMDQISQQDASSVLQFKTDLDQLLKSCNISQNIEVQSQKLSSHSQSQSQSHQYKRKSNEKRSKSEISQDSSFNNRLHKIQDELKKREDIINQCTNMLEKMNLKNDNIIIHSSDKKKRQSLASNTPCLLMQKKELIKKSNRNKSLQLTGSTQDHSLIDVKHKRRLRSMQKKYGNVNSSFLNINTSKSVKIVQDNMLTYSPTKPFIDDQRINFNFFGNCNRIAPQSVTASSALNNFVQDLDSIKVTSNHQHSFQLETNPISPRTAQKSDTKMVSGAKSLHPYNVFKEQQSFLDQEDDLDHHHNEPNCNGLIGERHIESFAMTHRESNDDMNSNNLFETLDGNFDQINNQNELIVNANDYVSFKQTNSNKHNFQPESHQQIHKSKNSTEKKSKNNYSQHSITQEIQHQTFSLGAPDKNQNQSYNYQANHNNQANNIISLNFNQESVVTTYEVNQTGFFNQQQMESQCQQIKSALSQSHNQAKKSQNKDKSSQKPKRHAQRENLEPSPIGRNSINKQTSLKIECIKTQDCQIFTNRDNQQNDRFGAPLQTSKSQTKIIQIETNSTTNAKQSRLSLAANASQKSLNSNMNMSTNNTKKKLVAGVVGTSGGNIFQYSRHQLQNECKVFQPLLAKQRLQIDVGTKHQQNQSNQKSNESPISLTPKSKLHSGATSKKSNRN